MKKNWILLSIIIVVAWLGTFLLFWAGDAYSKREMEKVLNFLSQYDKNDQVAFIGDEHVYLSDRRISPDDVNGYEVEDFLYITKDSIYFYTFENEQKGKTMRVYCSDYDLNNIELVFSETYDIRPQLHMADDQYLYIMGTTGGSYYRYEFASKEYKYLGEDSTQTYEDIDSRDLYSASRKKNGFWDSSEEIIITRKEDGISKSINMEDILEVYEGEQINSLTQFFMLDTVEYKDEDVYVLCAGYGVFTVFKYDFEDEELTFYAWREVIDTDLCRAFFFEESN